MKIVEMYPKNKFNIGTYKSEFYSVKLFGMLCWTIRLLYSEKRLLEILETFNEGQTPFMISSTFPFNYEYKDDELTKKYYLPKPNLTFNKSETHYSEMKKFKKLKYLEKKHFNEIISGTKSLTDIFNEMSGSKEEYQQPYTVINDRIHNVINRLSNTTDENGLFQEEEYVLANQKVKRSNIFYDVFTGLYFLFDGQQTKEIEAGLKYLSDYGFGGNISTGSGAFDIRVKDAEDFFSEPASPDSFINLSLYVPTDEEIKYYKKHSDKVFYELLVYKGRISSALASSKNVFKKPVLSFREGGVFPLIEEKVEHYGKTFVSEERENFNIYFYGNAFKVKARLKNE